MTIQSSIDREKTIQICWKCIIFRYGTEWAKLFVKWWNSYNCYALLCRLYLNIIGAEIFFSSQKILYVMWSHRFPFKMIKSVIVLCCPSLIYIVHQIKLTLNERLYYSTDLTMTILFVKIYNLLHSLNFIQFIIIFNTICVIKSYLFESLNLNSNWHVMLIKKIFIKYGFKMIQ